MKKVPTIFMLCLLSLAGKAQTTVSTSTALPIYLLGTAGTTGCGSFAGVSLSFTVPASLNGSPLTEIELTFTQNPGETGFNMSLVDCYLVDNLGGCHHFLNSSLSSFTSSTPSGPLVATFKSANHSACLNTPNTANFSAGDNPNPNTSGNYGVWASEVNFPSHTNVAGTWTIYFDEGTLSEPNVSAGTLEFGGQVFADNQTGAGDNCVNPIQWRGQAICATTNGATTDPNTPGNALTGLGNSYNFVNGGTCNWMSTLENDIWVEFTVDAPGSTCISLSGLDGSTQSIVVSDVNADGDGNPCTGVGYTSSQPDPNWVIESCPDPSIYTTNGTATNQQHCFSAVPGVTYYLVIDGTGGATSPFYIDGTNGAFTALPIELSYFDGKAFDDYNLLTWVTISEQNNSHFEIEMSLDGKQFKNIAELQGKGTTTEISHYSFKHDNPPSSAYYRLKQVDYDGKYKYASVVFVRNISNTDFEIYPQPVVGILNVNYETKNSNTTLTVYNLAGNVVHHELLEQNKLQHSVQLNSIEQGSYIVELKNENFIDRKQFVKQ